jgi:general stress protein 26
MMVAIPADDGVFRARPMAVAMVDPSGALWFVTRLDSPMADEIRTDGRAVATAQGGKRYVSVSGPLDIVHDRRRVRALWRSAWNAWFPRGKTDPRAVLVRLTPASAEYWDTSTVAAIRRRLAEMTAGPAGPVIRTHARLTVSSAPA